MPQLLMHAIVEAQYRGGGWWDIVLDCGHGGKVLYGLTSPRQDQAACIHCEREQPTDGPTSELPPAPTETDR